MANRINVNSEELKDRLVAINRVTKVTKGGRTFTFAAIVAGGLALAILTGYVTSKAYLGLDSNFVYNPAAALMLQIFPTAGENFGEILGGIMQALSMYAIIPMIAGVAGFYISDVTSRLSGENA